MNEQNLQKVIDELSLFENELKWKLNQQERVRLNKVITGIKLSLQEFRYKLVTTRELSLLNS